MRSVRVNEPEPLFYVTEKFAAWNICSFGNTFLSILLIKPVHHQNQLDEVEEVDFLQFLLKLCKRLLFQPLNKHVACGSSRGSTPPPFSALWNVQIAGAGGKKCSASCSPLLCKESAGAILNPKAHPALIFCSLKWSSFHGPGSSRYPRAGSALPSHLYSGFPLHIPIPRACLLRIEFDCC